MKKFFKSITKLIVVAAIVFVVVYGIVTLTKPKSDPDQIAKTNQDYAISQKFETSYSGNDTIFGFSKLIPDNKNLGGMTPADYDSLIPATKKVNNILIAYYDYYVMLTRYESAVDNGAKSSLLSDMQTLKSQVDYTIEKLESVSDYKKANGYQTETIKRFQVWFQAYQTQTETLANIVDELRKYVCKVNYQIDVTKFKYTGEAKLELLKDYAVAVFKTDILGKFNSAQVGETLQDTSSASFLAVYDKFKEPIENSSKFSSIFQDDNKNANELNLFLSYGTIDKTLLANNASGAKTGFFQMAETMSNGADKKSTLYSASGTEVQYNFLQKYYPDVLAKEQELNKKKTELEKQGIEPSKNADYQKMELEYSNLSQKAINQFLSIFYMYQYLIGLGA